MENNCEVGKVVIMMLDICNDDIVLLHDCTIDFLFLIVHHRDFGNCFIF
jgi:hypothetical protein